MEKFLSLLCSAILFFEIFGNSGIVLAAKITEKISEVQKTDTGEEQASEVNSEKSEEIPSDENIEPIPEEEANKEIPPESELGSEMTKGLEGSVVTPTETIPIPQIEQDPFAFLKGIDGKFETDLFTGSATYAYPLSVPAGRNGMNPALFLSYSSSNQNMLSPVGYGWSLPANAVYRSTSKGIDRLYAENDFSADFFGNGGELIALDDTGGKFGMKTEGIFLDAQFTNNSWTIRDKKGTTFIFGSSIDFRENDPDDPSRVYKWMLERVEDTNGNFMTLSYTKENGEIMPYTIRYTGHGGEEGIYEIRFITSERTHQPVSYATGFRKVGKYFIDRIEFYSFDSGSPELIRTYDLDFDEQGSTLGKLMSITVRSGSLSYPPTVFEYYDGSEEEEGKSMGLLKKILFPAGGIQTITYKPSTAYRDDSEMLSNPLLPFIINTVHTSTVQASADASASVMTYEYEGGHYYYDDLDAYKKEYAGFHEVTITDPVGSITKLNFHQSENSPDNDESSLFGEYNDHICKKGRIYREDIFDGENHLLQASWKRWDMITLPDGDPEKERCFPFLAREVSATYDQDGSAKAQAAEYVYDEFGNILSASDFGEVSLLNEAGDFSDVGEDRLLTSNEYALNPEFHILSAPMRTTVTDIQENLIAESKIYYDDLPMGGITNGNVTKTETRASPDGSKYYSNTIEYNEYGLPIRMTDPRNNSTEIEYDSLTLFPKIITNAKGQSVEYIFDYWFGIPTEMKDPNGSRIVMDFDDLGRIESKKISNPEDPSSIIRIEAYSYDMANYPMSVMRTILPNHDGIEITSKTYFDGLGRTIQTRSEVEGSDAYLVSSVLYDERGNVQKELQPVLSPGLGFQVPNASALGTAYEYDALNRVISATNSVGTTANEYEGWTVTTTDPDGKTKDFVSDARGNLVEVREYLGGTPYSTRYDYNPSGNLVKITDAKGNVRNMGYDFLGRRTEMEDLHTPNDSTFGVYGYEYDETGNMTALSDAKDQRTEFSYDELSRITAENFTGAAGIEVSYTYDEGEFGIGKLSSVHSNAVSKSFAYDILGRVVAEEDSLGGGIHTTATTYDLLGNPLSITYPDGMGVEYSYNNAGGLESVRKNGEDIVTNIDYAPIGLISRIDYGNGVTTENIFDSAKIYRLTRRLTTKNGVKLQDISYTFDPVGNILQIVDSSQTDAAKTASYGYDDLHRMTSAVITNSANGENYTRTYTYDILGNMMSSDLGSYVYAGGSEGTSGGTYANPHAVTGIAGSAYGYDENGNLISGEGFTHSWDYRGRLVSSSDGSATIQYAYDEGGNRVYKKNIATGKTTYYPNPLYDLENGTPKNHISGAGLSLATVEKSPIVSGNTETVYEDAENGDTLGWDVYDNDPPVGVITNVEEPGRGRVISLSGSGTANGYRLRKEDGTNMKNTTEFVAEWSQKYAKLYTIYFRVRTDTGLYDYISYRKDLPAGCTTVNRYVNCKLPNDTVSGSWKTITRDLNASLHSVDPSSNLTEVNAFQIRGSGKMDDVKLMKSVPFSLYEDAEDGIASDWTIPDQDPPGAKVENVYDEERNSRVISLVGTGIDNSFRITQNYNDAVNFVPSWDMNMNGAFNFYYRVLTTGSTIQYIIYTNTDTPCFRSGSSPERIYCGIGSGTGWRSVTRDLEADLHSVLPDLTFQKVYYLLIRGNGKIDNLRLFKAVPDDPDSIPVNEYFTAFHHTDHLSSSSVETDAEGGVLEVLDYYPYGAVRIDLTGNELAMAGESGAYVLVGEEFQPRFAGESESGGVVEMGVIETEVLGEPEPVEEEVLEEVSETEVEEEVGSGNWEVGEESEEPEQVSPGGDEEDGAPGPDEAEEVGEDVDEEIIEDEEISEEEEDKGMEEESETEIEVGEDMGGEEEELGELGSEDLEVGIGEEEIDPDALTPEQEKFEEQEYIESEMDMMLMKKEVPADLMEKIEKSDPEKGDGGMEKEVLMDSESKDSLRVMESMTGEEGGYENDYKYTGKELDEDTGLYYYEARYYDADIGRFISLDPWEGDLTDPQSLNKYAYVRNNPMKYVDPTGKEPKWGQLGDIDKIIEEVEKTSDNSGDRLTSLSDHFSGNRTYTRDENNQLVDASGSMNVKRYIYTNEKGWIDMHHFFRLAQMTRDCGKLCAQLYSYNSERWQSINGNPSAWSYEDIPSDIAGIEFWLNYGEDIEAGEISYEEAVKEYLISVDATDPSESPNWEYIPHIIDAEFTLTNKDKAGLKGDSLRQLHREIFEKRSKEMQDKINEAHSTITD